MTVSYPLVSIVIPVYNGSDYLREAIDSALAQTYPNIEIVVVNDGSDDGGATEQIALSFGDQVRYFSKDNGGVASALNFAIDKMTGDYFSWLSHDDLYCPNKIEDQMRALSDMVNRARTVLYSDFSVFFGDNPGTTTEVRLPATPPEQFRYFITVSNSLHGCTLLLPKAAFDECGAFNETLRTTQDYDLWFRIAEKYRFVHIPLVLVKARQHKAQGSIRMRDIALVECNTLHIEFLKSLSPSEMAATHKKASLAYAEISASLRKRGFQDAAHFAASLAMDHWRNGTLGDVLKSATLIFQGKLANALPDRLRALWGRFRSKVRYLPLIVWVRRRITCRKPP